MLFFFCFFCIYMYISSHRFSLVFVRFQRVSDNAEYKPQVCLHSLFSGPKIAPQNILISLTYFFLFILVVDRKPVLDIEIIQAIQRHYEPYSQVWDMMRSREESILFLCQQGNRMICKYCFYILIWVVHWLVQLAIPHCLLVKAVIGFCLCCIALYWLCAWQWVICIT